MVHINGRVNRITDDQVVAVVPGFRHCESYQALRYAPETIALAGVNQIANLHNKNRKAVPVSVGRRSDINEPSPFELMVVTAAADGGGKSHVENSREYRFHIPPPDIIRFQGQYTVDL